MKKTIILAIAAAMLIFSIPTQSKADSGRCGALEELARTVMEKRQNGFPMKTLVDAISGIGDKKGRKAVKMMVIMAYDVPNYNSEEYEREAVNNFADKFYKMCIKDELTNQK